MRTAIKHIGDVITGKTPPTSNAVNYSSDDYMFVTPDDISDDTYIINKTKRYISRSGLQSILTNSISGTSIAVTCIGEVGRCAILQDICATNQQINSITNINTNIVNPIALYYWFKLCGKQLVNYASQTVMPIVSKSTFEHIEVDLPSLERQNALADSLSYMDDLINNNKQLSSHLSSFIQMIYDYWFVQFNFPDENGRPYKSSGGKMVYNEQLKQEIPEGWEVKRMIDLFDFERGTEVGSGQYIDNKLNDNYVKFYRVRDVGDDSSTWVSTNNDLRIVHPGDVVITLDGTIGKIGIDIDGAISGGLRHVVDHNKLISNGMIWAILQSYYVQESLRRYVSGRGSILAHAGGAINDLQTPYDKQTFINFQNIINPMFELMVVCSRESRLLASLRDWLLPMLMNGQVRINASKERNNEN